MGSVTGGTLDLERRYTIADPDHLPDDGRRYELAAGQLLVSPMARGLHQIGCAGLEAMLRGRCPPELYVSGGRSTSTIRTPRTSSRTSPSSGGSLRRPRTATCRCWPWRCGPPPPAAVTLCSSAASTPGWTSARTGCSTSTSRPCGYSSCRTAGASRWRTARAPRGRGRAAVPRHRRPGRGCSTSELGLAGSAPWRPARSSTRAMLDDGVDLADDAAVQRWIGRFNSGPQAARERVVGPPPGAPDEPQLELPPPSAAWPSVLAEAAQRSALLQQRWRWPAGSLRPVRSRAPACCPRRPLGRRAPTWGWATRGRRLAVAPAVVPRRADRPSGGDSLTRVRRRRSGATPSTPPCPCCCSGSTRWRRDCWSPSWSRTAGRSGRGRVPRRRATDGQGWRPARAAARAGRRRRRFGAPRT